MPEAEVALSASAIAWRVLIAFLLVAANGFFVASEFALVGARKTRIEALARAGNRRAKLAESAILRLDHYISGTQLGITLSSLGLGWVGESTFAVILISAFDTLPAPWDVVATHGVAGAIAFAIITFLHIVLGELAPKSLALLLPEKVSLWTAGPLILFSRIFTPFIIVLNGAANLLLRAVGLRSPTEMERVHRPEEIEMLLAQSTEHGLLGEEPAEMIRGVFHLANTAAAEVMTPRTDIVAIAADTTLEEATEFILDQGHSRYPVYEGSLDRIVGVLLARDVWRAQRNGATKSITGIMRAASFVPDTNTVEQLLRHMQREQTHLAVVIDEFGGTAGLVTIEDLVEEIVGEIEDELDEIRPEFEETEQGVEFPGRTPIHELNERYGLILPDEDYTTVAGFVMGRLGRLAHVGDEVEFDGGKLRVLAVKGRRVERLGLSGTPLPTETEGSE